MVTNVIQLNQQVNHLPWNLPIYLDYTLQHTHFNYEDEGTTHSSETWVYNSTMQFHNPEEHRMSHKISSPKSLQEIIVYIAPKVRSNMLRVLVSTPWYITIHLSHNDVGIPLAKK